MFKYRDHKGSLTESMGTVQEFDTKNDLIYYLRGSLKKFGVEFSNESVQIKPYIYDERINWNTHIVIIGGYGITGYTDGPVHF